MKCFLLSFLLLASPAFAQAEAPAPKRYELPNTQVLGIHSERLGRDYELYVWLPPSYASSPDRRYPVIFTTDAPQSFPLMTGLHRRLRASERGMQDAIIVGLG